MRAVVCRDLGPLDNLELEDRPEPEPGPNQVVVGVRAAGVNYVDGLICQGRYQIKPETPFVPGSEIAGEVLGVGPDVSGWTVGDRVISFCGFGGFAEQVAVHALALARMPDGIGFAEAGTLIQSYATMLFTLTRRTTLEADEWVLVLVSRKVESTIYFC